MKLIAYTIFVTLIAASGWGCTQSDASRESHAFHAFDSANALDWVYFRNVESPHRCDSSAPHTVNLVVTALKVDNQTCTVMVSIHLHNEAESKEFRKIIAGLPQYNLISASPTITLVGFEVPINASDKNQYIRDTFRFRGEASA